MLPANPRGINPSREVEDEFATENGGSFLSVPSTVDKIEIEVPKNPLSPLEVDSFFAGLSPFTNTIICSLAYIFTTVLLD